MYFGLIVAHFKDDTLGFSSCKCSLIFKIILFICSSSIMHVMVNSLTQKAQSHMEMIWKYGYLGL